ncbi:MAG: hypothetical protein J4452_04500 [Candidatus Aenigmarchaeota archaeon]|nr:hypothetical protein [Candidatus Aenigmarchaeota archaeon]
MKGNLKVGTKKLLTSVHLCVDCKVNMVRESNEFLCPKCGMVQDMIEGLD